MTIVLDSSALLAFLLGETGAEVVRVALPEAQMSTVNYSEVPARLIRDHPRAAVLAALERLDIRTRRPDEWLAIEAGLLVEQTRSKGLSLADRFCLVLARRLACPALTADRAWLEIADAVGVEVRMIR